MEKRKKRKKRRINQHANNENRLNECACHAHLVLIQSHETVNGEGDICHTGGLFVRLFDFLAAGQMEVSLCLHSVFFQMLAYGSTIRTRSMLSVAYF